MSVPQQLLLDLKPDWKPSLDNFVGGRNGELLGRLHELANPRQFDAIYLWGAPGCGKSHLLGALAEISAQRPVVALAGLTAPAEISAPPGAVLLVDDVQHLSAPAQIGLFRLFNASRLLGLSMLLSGPCAPLQLALREDLRTRIGQCLIYEIQPLTDDDKHAALQRHALMRGLRLDDNVVQYLLRHGRRDLPSLMNMVDTLDRVSLEQKRQPGIALLRELMQTTTENNPT